MSTDSKDTIKTLISRFNYKRVLNSNPQFKVISLLGLIDGKNAILTVEKTHFMFEDTIESQQQKPSVHNNNIQEAQHRPYSPPPPPLSHSRPSSHPSRLNQSKSGSPPPLYYYCENESSCV